MNLQDSPPDVLIVGAGLAGMMAAWAAQEEGARVLLLDRSSLGLGTNSALSNAVLAAPTADYAEDDYVRDTIEIGRGINRKTWVSRVARAAPRAMERLRACGLETRRSRDHYAVQSPAPEAIPGVNLVRKVAAQIKSLDRIRIDRGFYVTDILTEAGRTTGLQGLDAGDRDVSLFAPAVILATGGAGAVYLRNDNQKSILGQGYALAARAGLGLWDMEFVQFFPLVLAEPRLPALIVYPPFPPEVKLVDGEGRDLADLHGARNLLEAVMERRDAFSAALYARLETKGPVYLDYRALPDSWWDRNPLKGMTKLRFDFRNTPVAVAPAAHFFMGGVRIDDRGQTDLPGLYACGEMVWGLHGANRRGGNALTECLVSGLLAGREAAAQARENPAPRPGEVRRSGPAGTATTAADREAWKQLKAIAWSKAGVVRSGAGMAEGLREIHDLERRIEFLEPSDLREQIAWHDLRSAALVVKAILGAGLGREESRGSFLRQDYPRENDRQWLRNSCLAHEADNQKFTVTYPQVEL